MRVRLETHKTLFGILILGITALALPIILLVGRDITNLRSSAALPNNLEAEAGVLSSSGVNKQSDSNTSGGQFVLFKKQSATPTPSNKPTLTLNELKAFPTAYGGGAVTKGARGGPTEPVVVLINTLDYDAPLVRVPASGGRETYYTGGIEAALENISIGPRYIIFDVSGTINANLPITYDKNDSRWTNRWGRAIFRDEDNSGFITVLGQTAPEGGVTLYRTWMQIYNQQHIIFRHFRSRSHLLQGSGYPIGDDTYTNPILVGANNIIIDHVTSSHGGDKGMIIGTPYSNGWPMQNLTAQWNMVFDSATHLRSSDGLNGGPGDWDSSDNVSWFYNLSMSGHRTPNLGGGYEQLNFDIQNNVFQVNFWRLSSIVYGRYRANYINNYYDITDPKILKNLVRKDGEAAATPLIHASGNYYRNDNDVILEGKAVEDNSVIFEFWFDQGPLPSSMFTNKNMYGEVPNPAPLLTPFEARDEVLAKSGANRFIKDDGTRVFYRDSYDTQSVQMFKNRIPYERDWSNFTAPNIPQNKRPSNYYQSVIGIPEWFVQKHGITDKDQVIKDWDFDDYKVVNNAGYPAIEMYAAWVAHDFEELLELQ